MTDIIPTKMFFVKIRRFKRRIRNFKRGIRGFILLTRYSLIKKRKTYYITIRGPRKGETWATAFIPERMLKASDYPFPRNIAIVRGQIVDKMIVMSEPAWWELLNWNMMADEFNKLPKWVKKEIIRMGHFKV